MKETIIALPGTLCTARLFQYQKAAMQDTTDWHDGNHSNSDNLKEVAANIINSVNGKFALMGLSYGGIIAFEILRQAPERVSKLILLNTNYKKPSEATRAAQQRFLGMSQLGEFRKITTDFLLDAMLHPKHATQTEIREIVLKMTTDTGPSNFFNQVKAQLGRPDSSPDLPKIKCPTLVIAGAQDKICTPELHEEMAALIPNSILEIIEECGHLSTLEQPEKVTEIIKKWW